MVRLHEELGKINKYLNLGSFFKDIGRLVYTPLWKKEQKYYHQLKHELYEKELVVDLFIRTFKQNLKKAEADLDLFKQITTRILRITEKISIGAKKMPKARSFLFKVLEVEHPEEVYDPNQGLMDLYGNEIEKFNLEISKIKNLQKTQLDYIKKHNLSELDLDLTQHREFYALLKDEKDHFGHVKSNKFVKLIFDYLEENPYLKFRALKRHISTRIPKKFRDPIEIYNDLFRGIVVYKELSQQKKDREVRYFLAKRREERAEITGYYHDDVRVFYLQELRKLTEGKFDRELGKELFSIVEGDLAGLGIKYVTTNCILPFAPILMKDMGFYNPKGKNILQIKKGDVEYALFTKFIPLVKRVRG